MVLDSLRTKTHNTLSSAQLDYIIHIHEVKPWPPSPSLRTLRSLLIHWEHGDTTTSGFTNQVVPAHGRIEFNESFGLTKMRLMREVSGDTNKCGVVEFNLYEPRHDRGLKGQLLGSAALDLVAYGVIKEALSISIPIHCKRTYRNNAQPLLFLKIEAVEAKSSTTRERLIMMREASMEKNHGESVSALMSGEYAEEAEIASFTTHDDLSSHSSLLVTSGTSPPLYQKKETAGMNGSGGGAKVGRVPHQPDEEGQAATESSSMDLSSDIAWISKRIKSHSLYLSALRGADKLPSSTTKINQHQKEDERIDENETRRNHEIYMEEEGRQVKDEVLKDYPQVSMQKRMPLGNGATSSTKESVVERNHYSTETSRGLISSERKDAKASRKETRNLVSEGRVQQLEQRIKILEGELREAAGLEVSLYSVVAEHGSSMNKVHAPARRLSRLYFNANKHNPKSGRESASKSVVSGIVSAAKACGNDVPRLTFWLSNTVVLRAIISSKYTGMGKGGQKNATKKWESLSFPSKITRGESVCDKQKENVVAFVGALEKAEAWIFSRIIESLWWQTFTPRMQSGASIDSNTSKLNRRTSSSSIKQQQQQQGNFSVELWKKAFRDACERICPVRGGGHDCGCLPLLSKLIMEQVVARLDVAMFNGILRESVDEIPTDPVADPIADANVLPIPAGKASFGAGAHLKNAIGNWSRWLSDLFDMDDENKNENENEDSSSSSSKSPFYLLNMLSELMMLPKDMLLTPSIRKQVCPTFGLPLLTRILNSFVPDEFCPDPVPVSLLQTLNSQDLEEKESVSIVNLIPCEAAPIVYKAPSSVATILALGGPCKLARSGSSILNKSQTSDDELDQLDSPLKAVILLDTPTSSTSSVRYQLLRQVWSDE